MNTVVCIKRKLFKIFKYHHIKLYCNQATQHHYDYHFLNLSVYNSYLKSINKSFLVIIIKECSQVQEKVEGGHERW